MATEEEALDVLEDKIRQLEAKVYGESGDSDDKSNPVIDSLLEANAMMAAAVSGKDKFSSVFKRLQELNDYLELNPLSEDPIGLDTKVNILMSMRDELEATQAHIAEIEKLKGILDDDKIKNAQLLKSDLSDLSVKHFAQKEKLDEVSNGVSSLLVSFKEACLEISKSFFVLKEAVSQLEGPGVKVK